ncbi:MAG: protein phosphatase 2C domain-containing protein [Tannerella sp.]|jgi:serine/threonine protein phosphatase PrpC|nr:protein phosphatase 2C domain-containing protein [Tannerella sp.]
MSELKFTMTARCEAAGRPNNEDNFQLTDNLTDDQWSFVTGREVTLGEKGALMAVCDGMGGMNAGATASGLAIKTIKEWFASGRLTIQTISSQLSVMQYIEQAIIAADCTIKEMGKENKEMAGMGSTIVLAWIVGSNVYVGWCGDSRAYRFNPSSGLERLSHDHSYVQELVDSGKLSKDLAFDHPDNNIITRSLGDNRQTVMPDVNSFVLSNNDIILLCSDGLHGVLRDNEIESILSDNADSPENCRNALWDASGKAGWTDNVTITICRIVSGIENSELSSQNTNNEHDKQNVQAAKTLIPEITPGYTKVRKRKPNVLIITLIILFLSVIVFEVWHYLSKGEWWSIKEFQDLIKQISTIIHQS